MRFGDVPPIGGAPPLPEADKKLVMHVELPILGGHVLMGMDALQSLGFKFWGIYDKVIVNKQIHFTLGDGRKVRVSFIPGNDAMEILETENENPVEMQRDGWQAILNNFKNYVEGL